VKAVRSVSEREATARKYSGSCSEMCQWVRDEMKGHWWHTVVVVAELDELVLEGCENGVEGVEGGLLWGVRLVQLYGLLSRHDGKVDVGEKVALLGVVALLW
jgi:hypothetical protein